VENVTPETLLDNIQDGVYFVDAYGQVSYWNKGAERITGYSRGDMLGSLGAAPFGAHLNKDGELLFPEKNPVESALESGETCEHEAWFRHKEGRLVPVFTRVNPIRNGSGSIIGALEVFSDNSSRVKARQRIEELEEIALIDPLTEVGNRRYAQLALSNAFEEMRRYQWEFGLLFADIDEFKALNDTYGHQVGDQILRMVAHALRSSLRSVDFVGRWGGEEFLVVLPNITDEILEMVGERCRVQVEQSVYQHDGKPLTVTVSLGAVIGLADETPEACVDRADRLLYVSKQNGKNRITFR